jgi:hypothetical protein
MRGAAAAAEPEQGDREGKNDDRNRSQARTAHAESISRQAL